MHQIDFWKFWGVQGNDLFLNDCRQRETCVFVRDNETLSKPIFRLSASGNAESAPPISPAEGRQQRGSTVCGLNRISVRNEAQFDTIN